MKSCSKFSKRKYFRSFLDALQFLDFFQHSYSLKIENRDKISITLGKLISLSILILLISNFLTSDMIQKNNPIVLSQNFENNQRPLISLNEQNFVLAFAVVDYDNIIRMEDPTIFSLTVSVITWDRINNEFNVSRTGTEPCTEKYLINFLMNSTILI